MVLSGDARHEGGRHAHGQFVRRLGAVVALLVAGALIATPAAATAEDGSPLTVELQPTDGSSVAQGKPFGFKVVAENPTAGPISVTYDLKLTPAVGEAVWFAQESRDVPPGSSEFTLEVTTAQWFEELNGFQVELRASDGDLASLPFTVTAPELIVPTFNEVTAGAGLATRHRLGTTCNGTHSAGAAWGDVEGDGDLDLYLPDQRLRSKLFINEEGSFTQRAAAAGVQNDGAEGHGAVFADYDNDGDQDLFVVNLGPDRLYENNGKGKFTDVAAAAGVDDVRPGSSASWGDYDADGNLDLYVARWGRCNEDIYYRDSLYRSEGDGTFSDRSAMLEDTQHTAGRGFLGGWFDADGDADLDLFLANDAAHGDFPQPNGLWRNDGHSVGQPALLSNVSAQSGVEVFMNSMGIAFGDYDRDLDLDVGVSNIGPNVLNQNDGDGNFSDVAEQVGVDRPTQLYLDDGGLQERRSITWGLEFNDLNNDGWEDLYIAAGAMFGPPTTQPNELYVNDGQGGFQDLSAPSGLADPAYSRGLAFGDYDRDGRLDVYVVNRNDQTPGLPRLYRNVTPRAGQHWLQVDTVGRQSNRDGCGAWLVAHVGAARILRQVYCGSTSLSSGSDPTVHFGLGSATKVDRLEILWPSGEQQQLSALAVDRMLVVREPAAPQPLRLKLRAAGKQRIAKALRIKAGANADSRVRVSAMVRRGTAAAARSGSFKWGAAKRLRLKAGEVRSVRLKPKRSVLRRLRRGIRNGASPKVKIVARGSGADGGRDRVTRRVTLR